MRKSVLLFCVFVLSSHLKAQTFYDRNEYMEYVFGGIGDSTVPTGFLLNRHSDFDSIDWQVFTVSDGEISTNFDLHLWLDLYCYLNLTKTAGQNLALPPKEELFYPLFTEIYSQEPEKYGLHLPIMMLDFEVNQFSDDAISNGNIVFNDGVFSEGSNAQEGVLTKEFFCVSTFTDSVFFDDFWLRLDPKFLLTNRSRQVSGLDLIIRSDTFRLALNEEINIAPYLESENFIETIFYFSDSTLLRTGFLLDGTIRTRDLEDEFELEEEFFDEVGSILDDPMLRYGIKWGCGNTSGDFKKPAIFVAGFGASIPDLILEQYQYLLHNDLTEYYHHFNLTHLLDELLATGHDVVVVRFIEPLESIIDGAARLEHLIHLINERKYANGSYIENVITGYSAGAIMVRYALTEMEYLHYGSGHQHPHTKLYVSFEGEQDGANVALGSQHALQHMTDNHTDIVNLFLSYIQNSDQSRELSRYFYDQTGKLQIVGGVEVSSSQGQGPHDDRLDLMYDFNYDQITPKQIEKMGYYGYPAFSRNVCVTNGSRHTEYFNGNLVQNSPYLFSPGQTIFMKETSNKKWQVNWASNLSVYGFSGPSTIFLYREENIWGNTVLEENYRTDNNMLILDNAPGGFIQGVDPVALVFKDMKVELEGLFGDPDIYNYFSNCFTPLVFTLDIRNFTHSAFDFQLHYDLQEQELMHDDFDFDNTPQSDFYGYPVLGHPVNHFSITPFEAIYADEFNQSHISSYNIELGGASVNDLYETGHPHIKNFIIGEIQYYWVFLQNQQVGWNTEPGGTYKAEYEAESTIVIGEFVTPRTDIAPYVVLENATVICHAGEEINLRQGFHAVAGSDFHAFIEAPAYTLFNCTGFYHAPQTSNDGNLTEMTPLEMAVPERIDIETSEKLFVIYPNPSTGEFTVLFPESNSNWLVEVFDLNGKLIYSGSHEQNAAISISVPPGFYQVHASSDNQSFITKLIVH